MNTPARGGLPALISKIKASFSRAISHPERWLIKGTLLAAVIACVYYSGDKAKDLPTQIILILIGLSAVGFHYVGAQKACRSWFERQPGAFIGWVLIVCAAVSWEINSQMSIASNNQANLSTAALTAATRSEDARGNVELWTATVKRLTDERSLMKPVRSAADARALIDNSKAARNWQVTDGCKETNGPKTRAFCEAYNSAQADVALWDQISVQEGKLANAQAKLEEAKTASATAPVVASAERADLRNLKRLTGLSDADLELSQSLQVVFVLACFLTLAGWMVKAEEYEGKPRRPWINIRRHWARIMGEPIQDNVIERIHEIHHKPNAVRMTLGEAAGYRFSDAA